MTTTDSARLTAPGVPLALANGRTVNLRYGFRGIMALEDEFGGVANVQTAISGDMTGPALRPLVKALVCGLAGEHDGTGQPLTAERLVDDELLSVQDLKVYADAFGAALAQAFPPSVADVEGTTAATAPTPGTTGTTSAP